MTQQTRCPKCEGKMTRNWKGHLVCVACLCSNLRQVERPEPQYYLGGPSPNDPLRQVDYATWKKNGNA